jgi:alkylation response protein AidB-like acyl-CoA dehydrogenase
MDVAFTEEQELLRSSARDFLDRECPPSVTREVVESGPEIDTSQRLWERMAGLGWMGLGLEEEHGGLGHSLVDVAILAEEMGRAVVPTPWFSTVAMLADAIRVTGSKEQRVEWLSRVADGKLKGTFALLEPEGTLGREGIATVATPHGDAYVLDGTKAFVPDLSIADAVVVAAQLENQPALFVLDRDGLDITEEPTLDPTRRLGTLRLSGLEVPAERLLGGEPCGWSAIEQTVDRATAILCAEMCGGSQKTLDLAVAYAKERHQFGRPIGSFQGVSHRCAEMLLAIESARSLTYYAAWCCDEEPAEAALAVSAAKAWCGDTYKTAAAQSIQIHGGVGFTWEANLHLWYRRAFWSSAFLGDPVHHRERVVQLAGI